MNREDFSKEELQFMDAIKYSPTLNKHSARRLIDESEEQISDWREKLPTMTRIQKNQTYLRISARQKYIKELAIIANS